MSEGVREAYKSREEEARPWRAKVRGLREENRVLRRMAGWDPPEADSDDDDGDEMGEGGGQAMGRGRVSQQGGGGGEGGQ